MTNWMLFKSSFQGPRQYYVEMKDSVASELFTCCWKSKILESHQINTKIKSRDGPVFQAPNLKVQTEPTMAEIDSRTINILLWLVEVQKLWREQCNAMPRSSFFFIFFPRDIWQEKKRILCGHVNRSPHVIYANWWLTQNHFFSIHIFVTRIHIYFVYVHILVYKMFCLHWWQFKMQKTGRYEYATVNLCVFLLLFFKFQNWKCRAGR